MGQRSLRRHVSLNVTVHQTKVSSLMLDDIHSALRRLLHDHGNMSPEIVDIRFEAPTRELMDRLLQPAVCLFLFEARENTELRQGNFQAVRVNGHSERRMPPRRMDLNYLVTAVSTEPSDEQELFWRVMVTLLKYQEIPEDVLPESLRGLEPAVTTRLWKETLANPLDLWSGLGARPHPSLLYTVTVPVDLDIAIQSPLVLTRSVRFRRANLPDVLPEERVSIGGTVCDAARQPVAGARVLVEGSAMEGTQTDAAGEFTLAIPRADAASGAITLRIVAADGAAVRVPVRVPGDVYDVILPAPKPARKDTR